MRIGIIGSGMIGGQVARLCVAAGLDVAICNSRGPETITALVGELGPHAQASTFAGAVEFADLIVLAVPFYAYREFSPSLLAGKTVIDTMNYYPQRDGIMAEVTTETITTSELLQRHLAQSHVVRALNNMDFISLGRNARPVGAPDRSALPVASDDPVAKDLVTGFLNTIGYDAIDMGALSDSWRSAPTTPLYVAPYHKPVSKREAELLLHEAVRHDRMFG